MKFLCEDYLEGICGIDEVGCGSLYGPIVASALIIPKQYKTFFIDIKDSKKLSENRRLFWYKNLISYCPYSIGIASSEEVDKLNVRNANILACTRAADQLKDLVANYFIDGNLNFHSDKYISIVKGDEKYIEIASASIVAKVFRDTLIKFFDILSPGYNLRKNKGYATRFHVQALQTLGLTHFHRKTFLNRIFNKD